MLGAASIPRNVQVYYDCHNDNDEETDAYDDDIADEDSDSDKEDCTIETSHRFFPT